MTPAATIRGRLSWVARAALWPAGVAYGLAATTVASRHGALTTYAGHSVSAGAAELAGGWALMGAGLLTWSLRPANRVGPIATAAGFAWLAPDWAGWQGGPAIVRSAGVVAAGLSLALVLHLAVAWPDGKSTSRVARVLVVGGYLAAGAVALVRALLWSPFDDPNCWSDCSNNSFLIHGSPPLARAVDRLELGVTLGLAIVVAGLVAWRLGSASAHARRAHWLVLVAAAGFALGCAVRAGALIATPLEDPSKVVFAAGFGLRCAAFCLLAAGLAWSLLRVRLTRAELARLAAELGDAPPPGSLEGALARAVGDPTLAVAYWLPTSTRYVDSRGYPVELPASANGRATTSILREGKRLAVVLHDRSVMDGRELAREIGAAARAAVDNERLQAEARAQLVELRASRARIVEAGDAERRRLERDLHDGAQQRLLALSYDLRLARAGAEADGASAMTGVLEAAVGESQAALGELRDLAQGIYPVVLAEAGLAAALETLADGAPLPVELRGVTPERFAAPVESAAYLTVVEALDDAVDREAVRLVVDVALADERLVVDVHDDGAPRTSTLVHLADRIGALAGTLDVGRNALRAEIPCA